MCFKGKIHKFILIPSCHPAAQICSFVPSFPVPLVTMLSFLEFDCLLLCTLGFRKFFVLIDLVVFFEYVIL